MKDEWALWVTPLLIATVFAFLMLFCAYQSGFNQAIEDMQRDAAAHGAATWATNERGRPRFRWVCRHCDDDGWIEVPIRDTGSVQRQACGHCDVYESGQEQPPRQEL